MKERDYQARLIKELERRYPGCFVMKNDSYYIQGVPDLTILHNGLWAMLEVKVDEDSHTQPNQEYYINKFEQMSYAAFVHPKNEEKVLRELDEHFGG